MARWICQTRLCDCKIPQSHLCQGFARQESRAGSKQIETDYPKAWQQDLEPFTCPRDQSNADKAEQIKSKLKDPFAPYRGSVLDATESNLPESAFGRLLRVVIPALYLEPTQQAAGRRLLDLAARGTRAFLADVCNA